MGQYIQIVGAVLLSAIFVIIVKSGSTGIGELLTLAICAMVMIIAVQRMRPILELIETLGDLPSMNTGIIKSLIKVLGISVTAEIAQLLCDDVGSKAMGKSLQYLATAVSVCLMIPMIQALLSLIEEVLSKI